jgi:hypothetical protein
LAKVLDLDGQKEEGATLVTASPTEVRAACEYTSTADAMSATNLENFASASAAIAHNKPWVYQQNARGIPRNVADEYAHLLLLAPKNVLSNMRSTRARNSVKFKKHETKDVPNAEDEVDTEYADAIPQLTSTDYQ